MTIHQTSLDPNSVMHRNLGNLAVALEIFLHSKATSQCLLQAHQVGKNRTSVTKKRQQRLDFQDVFTDVWCCLKHISTTAYFFFSFSFEKFREWLSFESAEKKFKVRSARTFLASPWSGSILSANLIGNHWWKHRITTCFLTPEPSLSISQKSDSFALRSTGRFNQEVQLGMCPGCAAWDVQLGIMKRVPFQLTKRFP